MKACRSFISVLLFSLLVSTIASCGLAQDSPQPATAPPTLPTANPSLPSRNTIPPAEEPALTTTTSPAAEQPVTGKIFFDDFSYDSALAMTANGWILRDKAGWPGIPGASWSPENVSFVDDPDQAGNRLLQMVSATNGVASGTHQTQVCHQRKYLEGTYAARVRFSNQPLSGPDGDQLVETFYMISPLQAPLDPDFSEMDNEYLPNGGWGYTQPTFFVTTWETAQIEPWIADNLSETHQGSLAGWHTLLIQVGKGDVNYLLDGNPIAHHWGKTYPESPMSINFNLWFIDGGLLKSDEIREWVERVDWVYFEADTKLSPAQVEGRLQELRAASSPFLDTVPAWDPPLDSPCDL